MTTEPLTRTRVAVTDPPGWTKIPSATTSIRVRLSPANTSTQPTRCGLATVGPVLEAVGNPPLGGVDGGAVVVVGRTVVVVGAAVVVVGRTVVVVAAAVVVVARTVVVGATVVVVGGTVVVVAAAVVVVARTVVVGATVVVVGGMLVVVVVDDVVVDVGAGPVVVGAVVSGGLGARPTEPVSRTSEAEST